MKSKNFVNMFMYALLVHLTLKAKAQDDQDLTLGTKNGKVKGTRFYLDDNYQPVTESYNHSYQLNAWLGIPFAEKPIGDLRFKRPVSLSLFLRFLFFTKILISTLSLRFLLKIGTTKF
jgi:hypothetical protein